MVYGIIMAGGKGLRMNSNIPKQYMILDDKPILVHTVEVLLCSNLFNIVYIVIGNVWKEYTNELLLKYFSKPQLDKIKLYPCEPLSRTYSLSQAINNIVNKLEASNEDIAIVHDADRPFVTNEVLIDCIDKAKRNKVALAVIPSEETMYIIDNKGFLADSIGKDIIRTGQSPFGSKLTIMHCILNSFSKEELIKPMTISQLYIKRKIPISISNGSKKNIKITTKDDLLYAEYIKKSSGLGGKI